MTYSTTICSKCGHSYRTEVCQSVNAKTNPDLKQKIVSGEFFLHRCPQCGNVQLVKFPFLYNDPSENLVICLSDQEISAEGTDGLIARRVTSVGDLIEKIKIIDAGLNDAVIEMCKFVTARDLDIDGPMKFLKTDGPDNEMIFTFPKNNDMEMISVGFHVYQECSGIVSRNPQMLESVKGLARIDADWVKSFLA